MAVEINCNYEKEKWINADIESIKPAVPEFNQLHPLIKGLLIYVIKFKDTYKTNRYFDKMTEKKVINFLGISVVTIKGVPHKVEHMIRCYLLRERYSNVNFSEILSFWKLYHQDPNKFKTDNVL